MKKLILSIIFSLTICDVVLTQTKYDSSGIFDYQKYTEKDKIPNSVGLTEAPAQFINFDDFILTTNNSVQIASNRYSGVSFYSPYSNVPTWLTYADRYSYPNSLIVGSCCSADNSIYSSDTIVIDFATNSKDVSFWWGTGGFYNPGSIIVYENSSLQLVYSSSVNLNQYWNYVSLSNVSQKIRRIVLQRPNANYYPGTGHIYIDNFQFANAPATFTPVGSLYIVQTTGSVGALGWSADPDSPSASNSVSCYVDGVLGSGRFIGTVPANNPSSGLPYSGNHNFVMPIPLDLRDGIQHQMYCYGTDISGGDGTTILSGSPKPFKFNAPIGFLDGVTLLTEEDFQTETGDVFGWSLDADSPNFPNPVHFYINGPAGIGTYVGQVLANIPRPDVNTSTGLPGDHGFKFAIPDQYRDGNTHTIYAHGIDITGDNQKLLSASPKSFMLNPRVSSLTFENLSTSTIRGVIETEANPNAGGGQRIFPDKDDPSATIDPYNHATVQVKAFITPAKPGITVRFKNYDLDDPSANTLPLDDDSNPNATGNDNRGDQTNRPPTPAGKLSAVSAVTNASGMATVNFTTTMQPGDNFAVAASTSSTFLNTITIDGTNLKTPTTPVIPMTSACTNSTVNACRTDMLTVWRRLHVEVDSMGVVANNFVSGSIVDSTTVTIGTQTLNIISPDKIELNRFENGILKIQRNGNLIANLVVNSNTKNSVNITSLAQYNIIAGDSITLFDDDNLNSNHNGDQGYNVEANNQTLSLMLSAFATAYLLPEYQWAEAAGYNQNSVQFGINRTETTEQLDAFLELNRGSKAKELDDFWISHIFLAYQPQSLSDLDPFSDAQQGQGAISGTTLIDIVLDSVASPPNTPSSIPNGGDSSLVYLETTRDIEVSSMISNYQKVTTIHELGHQMGLKGDASGFGLMSNQSSSITFVDSHLNILRSRVKSPGN
jgi:hypothetical protein